MVCGSGGGAVGIISLIASTMVWPYLSVRCQRVSFVEIANRVDETVMGSVTDLLESAIQHDVRTAEIPDAWLSENDLTGVPLPVVEPLLTGIVVFVRNVILYL